MSQNIYDSCDSELIDENSISDLLREFDVIQSTDNRYDFCSMLDTIYYTYSVMLTEIRQKKREIMTAIFESNPKLSQEKSVLKEKLDAEPEYASVHEKEEKLFQFLEHIQNIKNNVVYLLKDEDNE